MSRKFRALRPAAVVAVAFLPALLLVSACGSDEDEGPSTAEIKKEAMYSAADREQHLIDCAKDEDGAMQWSTSSVDPDPLADAFMDKYPDVKVEVFREDGEAVAQRLAEEYAAGKHDVDVIETTVEPVISLRDGDYLVPFTFPDKDVYVDGTLDPDGYYATSRESYIGFGYNTDLVDKSELPKTTDDLLDPQWKSRLAIPGSNTARRWLGALELTKGQDFVDQMLDQDLQVFDVSGRALADLVISGEVEASPTIFDSHVYDSQKEGAPIAWIPLEPVVVNNGAWALPSHTKHPCGALLLIDFALTKEGQEIYMDSGYGSAREDLRDPANADLEKIYLSTAVDDYEAAYEEWDEDFQRAQEN